MKLELCLVLKGQNVCGLYHSDNICVTHLAEGTEDFTDLRLLADCG